MTINDEAAYQAHMAKVDAILNRVVGLGHEEGEDTDTRSRFDAGWTPTQHANAIIEDWGVFDR